MHSICLREGGDEYWLNLEIWVLGTRFYSNSSISETIRRKKGKYIFSESSLQDQSKNQYLVSVGRRVIKIFGVKD